jgi:hypothetical protein
LEHLWEKYSSLNSGTNLCIDLPLQISSSFWENLIENKSRTVRNQAVRVPLRINEAMERHPVTEGEPDEHQLLRADRILVLHLFLDFFDGDDEFIVYGT